MGEDKATQTEDQPLPDGYYPRCSDSTPIACWSPVGRCLWCNTPYCSWEVHCEHCKRTLVKLVRTTVSRDVQTYMTVRRSSDGPANSHTSEEQVQPADADIETLPFSQNSILTQSDRGPSSTQDSPFDWSQ